MNKALWVVLGVVGLIVVLALFVGGSYVGARNTMVQKNEDVDQAYAQVDVVQQRRLDLIPNLLAAAGNRPGSIQANTQLSAAIVPLFRLQEAYPNLKGNDQFMRLEDELAGTENRIAVERQRYNKTLEDYNVYVKQFPNNIWAGMAGYHYRDEYFKGNAANSVAPTVDFSK